MPQPPQYITSHPPHPPQQKERAAVPPLPPVSSSLRGRNTELPEGSRPGQLQRHRLAPPPQHFRRKGESRKWGPQRPSQCWVPGTPGDKAEAMQSLLYPHPHHPSLPSPESGFLEPHKVLPATGLLLMPLPLPQVSSPQIVPGAGSLPSDLYTQRSPAQRGLP